MPPVNSDNKVTQSKIKKVSNSTSTFDSISMISASIITDDLKNIKQNLLSIVDVYISKKIDIINSEIKSKKINYLNEITKDSNSIAIPTKKFELLLENKKNILLFIDNHYNKLLTEKTNELQTSLEQNLAISNLEHQLLINKIKSLQFSENNPSKIITSRNLSSPQSIVSESIGTSSSKIFKNLNTSPDHTSNLSIKK